MSFSDIAGSRKERRCTMTVNFRAVLSPLLIISYIFGTRIVEFPAGQPRWWYSSFYIVLLWSLYYTLLVCTLIRYIESNSLAYQICFWINHSTALLSVLLGIYYDKKFRNCLRKLDIVDDTLKKLGTMIDYHKLYMRVFWNILGWLVCLLWITCGGALWHGSHCNTMQAIYKAFMLEYATYVNLLDDLIITSILGYIELKFDQINEHLRKLNNDTKFAVQRAWEHSEMRPHQAICPRSASNECTTWIVIHLHLELRKLSHELNSIFGLQMTAKMSTYFAFIALCFSEIFNILMLNNYKYNGTLYLILAVTYLILITFKLFIINYMCEKVSIKANATGDVINIMSYSTCDVVVRENISLFLLQMSLVPLRFYGLRLFQFGFKFFQEFCASVTTVIVILVQSHTKT